MILGYVVRYFIILLLCGYINIDFSETVYGIWQVVSQKLVPFPGGVFQFVHQPGLIDLDRGYANKGVWHLASGWRCSPN